MARRTPRGNRQRVAGPREEGNRRADEPRLQRRARGSAVSWLDRRAGAQARRGDVQAAVHAAPQAQPVVEAERRHRGAPRRGGADAGGGARPGGGRGGGGAPGRGGRPRGGGRGGRGARGGARGGGGGAGGGGA